MGQNFCVEPAILDLIQTKVRELHPEKILEIGGGLGALSEYLVKLDLPLTIVEKDSNLATLLEQRFGRYGVEIINGDVLKIEQDKFSEYDIIIGNIPYEISSPLLFKIWSKKPLTKNLPVIVLTIQKEFALRLIAQPETQEYGRLSAMTQLYSTPRILKIYPPSAFYPVPKVAHGVVQLDPRNNIPEEAFSPEFGSFMIGLFNRKNKKVINSLEPLIKKKKVENLESKLREYELFTKRVRDIKPDECIELFKIWQEMIA